MRKPITAIAGAIVLAFALSPAEARKDKNTPLPCGDYDGVPSHNDCWPVKPKKKAECQVWIDAGNGTDDAERKEKYKRKYFDCVDWPGDYKGTVAAPADEQEPADGMAPDEAPMEEAPAEEAPPE
jgi:hypothetical protein